MVAGEGKSNMMHWIAKIDRKINSKGNMYIKFCQPQAHWANTVEEKIYDVDLTFT